MAIAQVCDLRGERVEDGVVKCFKAGESRDRREALERGSYVELINHSSRYKDQ